MKYIRECPECGRKIRFPLDKGKIRVFCTCGYNTVIDPDDTSLYKTGNFDLKPENKETKPAFGAITALISSVIKNLSRDRFINSLLEIKYKLQNIRYLPDRERNRTALFIIALVLLLAAAIYTFL